MKRYILLLLLAFPAFAFSAQEFFDACLDCNQNQARAKFSDYLDQFTCESSDPRCGRDGTSDEAPSEPRRYFRAYVYTNTGQEKGYSFVGNVSGSTKNIMPFFNGSPPKAIDFFNELDALRLELLDMYASIDAELAQLSGVDKSILDKSYDKKTQYSLNECTGSTTPFSYFHSSNRLQTNQVIKGQANNRLNGNIGARVENITIQFGNEYASVSARMVINETGGYVHQYFANQGILVWRISVGSGLRATIQLDLAASETGNGFGDGHNNSVGPNVPMNSIITQDANGNFHLTNAAYQVESPCMQEELNKAIEALGIELETEIDNEFGFTQPGMCGGMTHLGTSGDGSYTVTWEESYIEQDRDQDGVVTARVVTITRTMTIGANQSFSSATGCDSDWSP